MKTRGMHTRSADDLRGFRREAVMARRIDLILQHPDCPTDFIDSKDRGSFARFLAIRIDRHGDGRTYVGSYE